MPTIIETTVFEFGELSDAAKESARTWYRERAGDWDWFDFICDDFEAICTILGVELRTQAVRLMGGGTRQKPCIYFSGFWSQGDGACFEANYAFGADAPRKMRRHAPKDAELHRIADVLLAVQRRNFYQLRAAIRHSGRYYHEYCMSIDVERDSPVGQDMTADAEAGIIEALRDLARWLYRQLDREWEYQNSDEVVDESIAANGYTFTGHGRRFG